MTQMSSIMNTATDKEVKILEDYSGNNLKNLVADVYQQSRSIDALCDRISVELFGVPCFKQISEKQAPKPSANNATYVLSTSRVNLDAAVQYLSLILDHITGGGNEY